MIVVLKPGASTAQIQEVSELLASFKCQAHVSAGAERTIIGVIGDTRQVDRGRIQGHAFVERIVSVSAPYKLAGRAFHPSDTVFHVNGVPVGSPRLLVIAGPCAVESAPQLLESAKAVKAAGAHMLRGGAFKPRTSPYAFQGLGEEGLKILARARDETGLPVATEVVEPQAVPLVASYVDVLQIGARNMQNYALLQAVGDAQKPVLLKRGLMSTVEELLLAAEYILSRGNERVMLCERGIRTFERATRNTLDISAVPLIKQLSHLPVIVDPSHATGAASLVQPTNLAGIAAGADGLIIEVHPNPEQALSDGPQSLTPAAFAGLMKAAAPVAVAVGRTI